MTSEIKQLIEQHINLIDDNRFEELLLNINLYNSQRRGIVEVFLEAGVDFLKYMKTLPPMPAELTNFVIPETIVKISANAFEGSSLTSIVIPRSVKIIERMAFSNCNNLQDIYIPSSVVKIQEFVFSSCPNLTIHIEPSEVPNSWSKKWNSRHRPVITGDYQW